MSLIRKVALQRGSVRLSAGGSSSFYVNMKTLLLDPQGVRLAARLILERLQPYRSQICGVGGMSVGADPLVTATTLFSLEDGQAPLMGFFVRPQPKSHGTEQKIEGLKNFLNKANRRVFILEDVVTTGASCLRVVETALAAGLQPVGVLTCVDREEGGDPLITQKGLSFLRLTTKTEVLEEQITD